MKLTDVKETIESAVKRIDMEIAEETNECVGSYIDWLEDMVENYKYSYDPQGEDYEEWIISDLENEADNFIAFWKENN